MSITIPEDVTESELVEAVTASIAESLGVHPQDVEVAVDMETGDVTFVVTSDDFVEASAFQFELDNNVEERIIGGIEESLPSVTVENFEVADLSSVGACCGSMRPHFVSSFCPENSRVELSFDNASPPIPIPTKTPPRIPSRYSATGPSILGLALRIRQTLNGLIG